MLQRREKRKRGRDQIKLEREDGPNDRKRFKSVKPFDKGAEGLVAFFFYLLFYSNFRLTRSARIVEFLCTSHAAFSNIDTLHNHSILVSKLGN